MKRFPQLKWYNMCMYVHACHRMDYKPQFKPCELLCPEFYQWQPYERCVERLNAAVQREVPHRYARTLACDCLRFGNLNAWYRWARLADYSEEEAEALRAAEDVAIGNALGRVRVPELTTSDCTASSHAACSLSSRVCRVGVAGAHHAGQRHGAASAAAPARNSPVVHSGVAGVDCSSRPPTRTAFDAQPDRSVGRSPAPASRVVSCAACMTPCCSLVAQRRLDRTYPATGEDARLMAEMTAAMERDRVDSDEDSDMA